MAYSLQKKRYLLNIQKNIKMIEYNNNFLLKFMFANYYSVTLKILDL